MSQECGFFVTCKWNTPVDWFLLAGSLFPTSMRISEEGRLVVNFKTEARFHGLFVMSHPGKCNLPLGSTAEIKTPFPNFILLSFFSLFLLLITDFFGFYILRSSDTDFSSARDLFVIDDCIQVVKLVQMYINLMKGK